MSSAIIPAGAERVFWDPEIPWEATNPFWSEVVHLPAEPRREFLIVRGPGLGHYGELTQRRRRIPIGVEGSYWEYWR